MELLAFPHKFSRFRIPDSRFQIQILKDQTFLENFAQNVTEDEILLKNDWNFKGRYEGDYVFTFWSHVDEIIGYGDIVWGEPTSEIEWQTGEKTSYTFSHMQMKDNTAEWQKNAIVNHSVNWPQISF